MITNPGPIRSYRIGFFVLSIVCQFQDIRFLLKTIKFLTVKKVFFLIAFLFAIVYYAAPPSEKSIGFLTEDVGIFCSQGDIAVLVHEVQKVTFVYIGNELYPSLIVTINNSIANSYYNNGQHDRKANKQNINFGYPFVADF